jgi:hypothetical protein
MAMSAEQAFWDRNYYQLGRIRYPDELLAHTMLEAQGHDLGEWIVESFAALAQDPPAAYQAQTAQPDDAMPTG